MNALALRTQDEDGQVIVFVVAILTVMIGIGALVIDGGSWFRTQRHLQTAADAAALAGVQNLPASTGTSQAVAIDYAQQNYAGLPAPAVTFPSSPSPWSPNVRSKPSRRRNDFA